MRVDALSRLIGSFEFYQLREIALRYLSLIGYKNPVLTDGWSDGGTDLRVLRTDGFDSTIVFQVSVEKNWEGKLRSDVSKAIKNYSPATFMYVSSRRIPELKFTQIATEFRTQGLSLLKVDGQALASLFFESNDEEYLLQIAGLNDLKRPSTAPSRDFKEDAAYAYLFLSGEVRDFREHVLERAVLSRVVEKDNISRQALENDMVAQLGLHGNQRNQVASAIDRLLTRGDLTAADGILEVRLAIQNEIFTARVLADDDWRNLKEKALAIVSRRIKASERGRVDADRLLGYVGSALAMASAMTRAGATGSRKRREALLPSLRDRLQQLTGFLAEVGIAEASQRTEVLEELIAAASGSPPGQALMAAELFLVLSGLDTSRLARALGSPSMPPIILDASVAIPMVTSLLYRPGKSRYFFASHQLYQQAESHNAKLKIPKEYLEEMATHLIDAWRNYLPLLGDIEALERSTNAYVAHFSFLKLKGRVADFSGYVKGLGINPNILNGHDFYEIRRIIAQRLEDVVKRYGIGVTFTGWPSGDDMKAAEEEISYASRHGGYDRAKTTLRHDAHVIAHMDAASRREMHILCSWDRLLLDLRENESHTWLALDPSALSDLMALAAGPTPGQSPSIVSPIAWARALVEDDMDRSAAIWDRLAVHEKRSFMDAELLSSAREFVSGYAASARSTRPHELIDAWISWKKQQ